MTKIKWRCRVPTEKRSSGLKWHHEHPERAREVVKNWDAKNPGKRAAQNKAWYAAHPNYKKAWRERMKAADPQRWKRWLKNHQLRSIYGITVEQFDAMLLSQGGGCAACDGPPQQKRSFHVDHDHKTGAVRGLICNGCNAALGHMKEDPDRLQKLIDYIIRCRYRRLEVVR